MSESAPGVPGNIGAMSVEVSPDFQVIYSNLFRYRLTHNEFALIFSTMADPHGGIGPATVTDRVQIILSLSQTKALLEYLTLIVGTYEQEFGRIKVPGKTPPDKQEIENIFSILKGVGTH